MADNGNNNLAELNSYGRRWFGARGDAAQKALSVALEIVLDRLNAPLVQLFDRLDDTLFGRAEMAASADLQDSYFNALRDMRLQRNNVVATFSALVTRAFEQGSPRDMEIPRELTVCAAGDDRHKDDDAEEELAVAGLVRKIRENCGDSLKVLDKRMGFLLEDPDLECWHNPLGPQTLCDAFRQAAEQIKADLVVRLIIFKLFDRCVVTQLQDIYKELDRALLNTGVLPGVQSPATRCVEKADVPMAPGIVPTRTEEPLMPPSDAVTMASGIVPGKQVRYPDSQSEEVSMAEESEYDPYSGLWAPMDNLAETVPMAPGIEPSGLATKLYPEADSVPMAPGIIPSGRALRPFVAAQRSSRAEVSKPPAAEPVPVPVASVEEKIEPPVDKMKAAQIRLQEAVAASNSIVEALIGGQAVEELVAGFVAGHWKELLKLICMREGKDSGAWKQAVATMDDLLWSVRPKQREQQCERLRVIQPRLIQDLRKGMQRLSLPADEQEVFLDELAGIHNRFLNEEETCEATIDPPVLDLETPEEVAAAAEAVVRKKPSKEPSTAKGKGLGDWQNGDHYTLVASHLKPGDWVEFKTHKGAVSHAKLTWNSPITNTLLFTDRQGLQAGNYTLDEFAGMLRSLRARVLPGAPRSTR